METSSCRNTKQRTLVLKCFSENKGIHLTAEKIYFLAKSQDPGIGIATVYRNIKYLLDNDIIKKVELPDSPPRYEMSIPEEEHCHHHLICLKCNKIFDFEDDLLESLEKTIKKTRNFTVTDHRVVFYGTCKECSQS